MAADPVTAQFVKTMEEKTRLLSLENLFKFPRRHLDTVTESTGGKRKFFAWRGEEYLELALSDIAEMEVPRDVCPSIQVRTMAQDVLKATFTSSLSPTFFAALGTMSDVGRYDAVLAFLRKPLSKTGVFESLRVAAKLVPILSTPPQPSLV
ncbi:hypothetical protein C8R44DRAFT_992936 [Mycena epipterygia]|nr:hypothetical protein C8R44DRAFT_992936 [Mycena epipterygia]